MLLKRTITAIVLLAILIPSMLSHQPLAFVTCITVLVAAGYWEWSKLNGWSGGKAIVALVIGAAISLIAWHFTLLTLYLPIIWLVSGIGWLLFGALLLSIGSEGWQTFPVLMRIMLGYVVLFVTFLSIVAAWEQGLNLLLSIMALVWCTDIGAYFSGRALSGRFFRRKLAPTISPQKSWEGVCGGIIAALILAYIWLAIDRHYAAVIPSLFSQLYATNHALLPIGVIFLSAVSVAGDLLESLCKRAANVKDSSNLLPGHGGVLDRVDALLPVLPFALLLYAL
jgi:phosphatidate cytidylyltransferase